MSLLFRHDEALYLKEPFNLVHLTTILSLKTSYIDHSLFKISGGCSNSMICVWVCVCVCLCADGGYWLIQIRNIAFSEKAFMLPVY